MLSASTAVLLIIASTVAHANPTNLTTNSFPPVNHNTTPAVAAFLQASSAVSDHNQRTHTPLDKDKRAIQPPGLLSKLSSGEPVPNHKRPGASARHDAEFVPAGFVFMRVPPGVHQGGGSNTTAPSGSDDRARATRAGDVPASPVLAPVPQSLGMRSAANSRRHSNPEPESWAVMFGGDDSAAGRLWYGIDLNRLANAESQGNDNARGASGELGRFQITRAALADVNAKRTRDGLRQVPFSALTNAVTSSHVAREYIQILARRIRGSGFDATPNRILCAWNDGYSDARKYSFEISRAPQATRRLEQ